MCIRDRRTRHPPRTRASEPLRTSFRRAFRGPRLRPLTQPGRRIAKSDSRSRRASKDGVAANMESSL
eukprot:15116245-Alexandrium_andersonii.AAC.1